MRYERGLQVKLRSQYLRLLKADYHTYKQAVGYFYNFVTGSPVLTAIIETIKAETGDVDADAWIKEKFSWQTYSIHDTEAGQAKITWHLVEKMAGGETDAFEFVMHMPHSSGTNVDAQYRLMTEKLIEPFVEYLEERISTESDVLYILEKLKRRVEWFDRDELYEAYLADTKHGEALYDTHIRQFLFDQGIDYPFSQPSSVSGAVDVTSGLDGEDPLVAEIKLYDDVKYKVPYIAKGLNQAVQYAQDFGKATAHLIVINLSDRNLQMPTDGESKEWPARLVVSGITVYIVVVRAKPLPSASKMAKQTTTVVERSELVYES